MSTKLNNRLIILAVVLSVASLALSGASLFRGAATGGSDEEFAAKVEKGINDFIAKKQAEQQGGAPAAPTGPVDVSIVGSPMKGDKNAPVTLVEFSDFECPFCSRFYDGALAQIKSEYIDKGKVRMVYRHFPLGFHANARPAALAAECARDQDGDDMFYKFHDKVYSNQPSLNVENLKKWAVELGLNAGKFNTCLESKKFDSVVEKDYQEGQSYGVSGTPAFFINGRMISGAQPFAAFKTIIDEELAKKK